MIETTYLVLLIGSLPFVFYWTFQDPKYGVFAVIFVFPFDNLVVATGVGADKLVYLIVLAAWTLHVLLKSKEVWLVHLGSFSLLVLYCLYSVFSIWYVSVLPDTLRKINITLFYVVLPILYIVYTNYFDSYGDLYKIGTAAGACLIATAGPGIIGYLLGVDQFIFKGQMVVPYASANLIGMYSLSLFSLSFLRLAWLEKERTQQAFNFLIVIVALLSLVLGQNRGALLALLVLLGLTVLVSRYRRMVMKFGSLFLIAGSVILYVFDGLRTTLVTELTDALTSGRAWLILGSTRILAEKPLFGYGHGSYQVVINDFYPGELVRTYNPWYYDQMVAEGVGQAPHGFYTAVAGELGFLGILLVGSLLMLSVGASLSQLGRQTTSDVSRQYAAVFVGLVSTLFVTSFYGAGRDHIVWFYIFLPFVLMKLEDDD